MMKNVCILSMQRINNFGSLLQAYALKKMLEEMNLDVSFLDIRKIEADNAILTGSFSFSETGIHGFTFSKMNKYLFNRIIYRLKEKKVVEQFQKFRETELDIGKTKEKYDICVIGSDEVFNCCNAGWWGFTTQLFGNVPEAEKVITYAASCGATSIDDVSVKMREKIREAFMRISAFSVRDSNTKAFVEALTGSCVTECLDPVLVYNFQKELQNIKPKSIKGRYCLIYAYLNRFANKDEYLPILAFCKKHRLTPIAIGSQQFWCKDYIVCTPFECLKLFAEAEFVITDTFHGTIFAAKYSSAFAVLPRKSNSYKLEDLIRRLGLEQHRITDFDSLETIYSMGKNSDALSKLLDTERKKTLEYLRENIYGKEQGKLLI